MLLKKASDIPSSEITDKKLYLRRREFIQAAAVTAVGAAAGTLIPGRAEAASWPAHLIVLGTHGRRGLRRAVLGSDAEQVVRRSSVPVLLVRAAN